jgi:hypothetical protein
MVLQAVAPLPPLLLPTPGKPVVALSVVLLQQQLSVVAEVAASPLPMVMQPQAALPLVLIEWAWCRC